MGHISASVGGESRAVTSLISALHFGFARHAAEVIVRNFTAESNEEDIPRLDDLLKDIFARSEHIDERIRNLYWEMLDMGIKANKGFKMMLKGLMSGYPNFGENIQGIFQTYLDNTEHARIAQNIYEKQEGGTIDKVLGTVTALIHEIDGATLQKGLEQTVSDNFEIFQFLKQKIENLGDAEIKNLEFELLVDKISRFARETDCAAHIKHYLLENEDSVVNYLYMKFVKKENFLDRLKAPIVKWIIREQLFKSLVNALE